MSQTTTQESPAIDRLLSYINEYRLVMEWLKKKHPDVFAEGNKEQWKQE